MSVDLAPCPFCGSRQVILWEAEIERPGGRSVEILWCVFCETCEAEGPHKTTAEVAASGWNARLA